jgi:hypothetical protein
MASNGLPLAQTKGAFQLGGKIIGVNKENFYKSQKTKTNKIFRSVSFGVQVDAQSIVYVRLNGMEQEFVYFSKRGEKKGDKSIVEKVEWSKRNSWKKEGFTLIGVNIGLEKIVNEKGQEVNNVKHLTPFDACDYVKEHLTDGISVFIKGNLEYSNFETNGNKINSVKLIPTQISWSKDIDFDAKDFERNASFTQSMVMNGIEQMDDKFVVTSNIINYNSVEFATFEVTNAKLATNLRKGVKPYSFLKVWGNIETARNIDTVEAKDGDDDGWGSSNKMDRLVSPYKCIFVITGADKDSIEHETYNEESVMACVEEAKGTENKKKDFESDDWGSTTKGSSKSKISKGDEDEDEETPW